MISHIYKYVKSYKAFFLIKIKIMIQVRCKIKSFDSFYIFLALNYLASMALFVNASLKGKISLPTKKKMFTVIKSPHKYKSAREQFQYNRFKQNLVLEFDNSWKALLFIQFIKDCEMTGTEIELEISSSDYFISVK